MESLLLHLQINAVNILKICVKLQKKLSVSCAFVDPHGYVPAVGCRAKASPSRGQLPVLWPHGVPTGVIPQGSIPSPGPSSEVARVQFLIQFTVLQFQKRNSWDSLSEVWLGNAQFQPRARLPVLHIRRSCTWWYFVDTDGCPLRDSDRFVRCPPTGKCGNLASDSAGHFPRMPVIEIRSVPL